MELVYLWIEDYKNIKNQGFNFSPKFECKYNPDTKELEIKNNKDYIENFFGENINITAIVGKNGSGKSSVVKIIYLLLYLHHKVTNLEYGIYLSSILNHYKYINCFIIIENNNQYFKIDINYLRKKLINNISNITDIEQNQIEEFVIKYLTKPIENLKENIDFFSINYNMSIDILKDNNFDIWIEDLYHRQDGYKLPILLEPAKHNGIINIQLNDDISIQRLLYLFKSINNNSAITTFFNPNYIYFDYAKFYIDNSIINELKKYHTGMVQDELETKYATEALAIIEKMQSTNYKLIYKYINFLKSEDFETPDFINLSFIQDLINLYDNKEYKKLNLIYLFFKLIEKKYLFNNNCIGNLKKIIEEDTIDINNLINTTENCLNSINLQNNSYKLNKIKIAIEFHNKKIYNVLKEYNNEVPIQELSNELFPAWLKVDFYENKKSFTSLSTGEKFKFKFIISLLYHLNNMNCLEQYNKVKLYLDEIEMGFHPEWQKSFLKELLFSLHSFSKQIHIYFLTHSPFVLSDIPKQNIIFLDTDENGNCKVVDGLKEKKQTFGANIHTLLSDSFFMEDGLMGEFAKSKIDEVIDYLNNKKSEIKDNEEAQNLINIIGEPILKRQLQKMLDSKRLKKVDEIDIINQRIKDMAYELEILKEYQKKIVKDELRDKGKKQYKQRLQNDKN